MSFSMKLFTEQLGKIQKPTEEEIKKIEVRRQIHYVLELASRYGEEVSFKDIENIPDDIFDLALAELENYKESKILNNMVNTTILKDNLKTAISLPTENTCDFF